MLGPGSSYLAAARDEEHGVRGALGVDLAAAHVVLQRKRHRPVRASAKQAKEEEEEEEGRGVVKTALRYPTPRIWV